MATEIKIMSSVPPVQFRRGRVASPETIAARNLKPGQWFRVTGGKENAKLVQRRILVGRSNGTLKFYVACYLDGDDLIVLRPKGSGK